MSNLMSKFFYSFLILLTVTISGCGSPPVDTFHLQKKYWDEADYDNIIGIIQYVNGNSGTDKLPCYAVAASKPAFIKMVDVENFKVVLDDTTLGLTFRNGFAKKMFGYYEAMVDPYRVLDREDKFVYPRELAEILNFGMEFQFSYFKIGNENVKKVADKPNSQEVTDMIKSNIQTLIGNFNVDLGFVRHEKAFNAEALEIFAKGLDKYIRQLMTEFPDADYTNMLAKAKLMQEKAETPVMKSTLATLIELLDAKVKSIAK